MSYAILRTKKLKSFGALARSARHTFREQPTPNADPARRSCNRTIGVKGAAGVVNAFRNALPDRRRKDAVLCIEYLVTASPEAFKRHGGNISDLGDGYFDDALKWLKSRHGVANVVSATLHLDETTPHLVAYVLPLTLDGRLSARQFLGGPKILREMQDSFYEACAKARDLLRGVRGAHARHESIKSFYATLAETGEAPTLSRKDYAAAALGVKTKAWHEAEKAAKSQANMALRSRRTAKAMRSKAIATEQLLVTVDEASQRQSHRDVLIRQRERDLEAERQRLITWQRELNDMQDRVENIECENVTLKRRLQPDFYVKKALRDNQWYEPNGPD